MRWNQYFTSIEGTPKFIKEFFRRRKTLTKQVVIWCKIKAARRITYQFDVWPVKLAVVSDDVCVCVCVMISIEDTYKIRKHIYGDTVI